MPKASGSHELWFQNSFQILFSLISTSSFAGHDETYFLCAVCSISFVFCISDSVCAVPGLYRPIGEPGAQHGETGQGCTGWDTRPAAVIHEEQRHRTPTGPLTLSNTTDKCPPLILDQYILHSLKHSCISVTGNAFFLSASVSSSTLCSYTIINWNQECVIIKCCGMLHQKLFVFASNAEIGGSISGKLRNVSTQNYP